MLGINTGLDDLLQPVSTEANKKTPLGLDGLDDFLKMRLANLVLSAMLLLVEMETASAKALVHLPFHLRRRDHQEEMARVAGAIERREPQTSSSMTLTTPTTQMNATIATACLSALANISTASNEAGMLACYNILQYDDSQRAFQADLRLYQGASATGSFAGVPVTDITVGLTYPSSTVFKSLMKRSLRNVVERRQSGPSEVQEYSLYGSFEKSLDLSKLNTTELISLMVPTITLNTANASSGASASTNLTAADGVWFVVGDFKNQSSIAAEAVTPAFAAAAITAASPYVIPGITLGIFPTGLIVTCAWTFLFVLAYGVGTMGRIRHRDVYRKRKAVTGGRTGQRI